MPKTSEDLLKEAKEEFAQIPSWDKTPLLLYLMGLEAVGSQAQEPAALELCKVIPIRSRIDAHIPTCGE